MPLTRIIIDFLLCLLEFMIVDCVTPTEEVAVLCEIYNNNCPSSGTWVTPCNWTNPCFFAVPCQSSNQGIYCAEDHVIRM